MVDMLMKRKLQQCWAIDFGHHEENLFSIEYILPTASA
jgi:hypothetical protein